MADVKFWNAEKVWSWISCKKYGRDLDASQWKSVNGSVLINMTTEKLARMNVPEHLIPRILRDIKSIAPDSIDTPRISRGRGRDKRPLRSRSEGRSRSNNNRSRPRSEGRSRSAGRCSDRPRYRTMKKHNINKSCAAGELLDKGRHLYRQSSSSTLGVIAENLESSEILTMSTVIQDKDSFAIFVEYIKKHTTNGEAFAMFLLAVESYEQANSNEDRKQKAEYIFNNFLEQEAFLVLPAIVIKKLKKHIKSQKFSNDLFVEASERIFNELDQIGFQPFLKTDESKPLRDDFEHRRIIEKSAGPSVSEVLSFANRKKSVEGKEEKNVNEKTISHELVTGMLYDEELQKEVFMIFRPLIDTIYIYDSIASTGPDAIISNCWLELSVKVILPDEGSKASYLCLGKKTLRVDTVKSREIWLHALQLAGIPLDIVKGKTNQLVHVEERKSVQPGQRLPSYTHPQHSQSIFSLRSKIMAATALLNSGTILDPSTDSDFRSSSTTIRSSSTTIRKSCEEKKNEMSNISVSSNLEEDCKSCRSQAIEDLLNTEQLFIKEMDTLIMSILKPIELGEMISDNLLSLDTFSHLVQSAEQIRSLHQKLLNNLINRKSNEDKFFNSIASAVQWGRKKVYYPYTQRWMTLSIDLNEEANNKLKAFLQKHVQNGGDDLSALLFLPIQRLRDYVLLLERIEMHTSRHTSKSYHIHARLGQVIGKVMDVAAQVQDCYDASNQSAQLAYLDFKVKHIPDNWKILIQSRTFLDKTYFVYVLPDGISDGEVSVDDTVSAVQNKIGENVRAFLFNECLLLTTMEYKYRYRLQLDELKVLKKRDCLLVLMLAMFDMENIKDTGESSTYLLCNSKEQRDFWAEKITRAIVVQKKDVKKKVQDKSNHRRNKVNLFLRIRPFVTKEEKDLGEVCLKIEGKFAILDQGSIKVSRPDRVAKYDEIFLPDDNQEDVFRVVGAEALGALSVGYSIAVLAYGATGAGKTYTMFGEGNDDHIGIVPRLLKGIYRLFSTSGEYKSSKIEVSYIQVYNDQVQDLCGHHSLPPLSIKNAGKNKFGIQGMKKITVKSVEEALNVIDKGNKIRTTRSHRMNESSSRSHAVFMVSITAQRVLQKKPITVYAHLVDLAGSENVQHTGVKGKMLEEAKSINKSLISLGRLIHAINENKRRTKGRQIPAPFRESKLNQILSKVLSGDCLVSLVLNTSQSPALGQAQLIGQVMAFGEGAKKLNRTPTKIDKQDRRMSQWLGGVWRVISHQKEPTK